MGAHSDIEWTHHTFNPWWGCEEVSPACANCYAKAWAKRTGHEVCGDTPRRFFGEQHWRSPLAWHRKAEAAGSTARVFCSSMCDILEDRTDLVEDRRRVFEELVPATPSLVWMLLTKRPENFERMVPAAWLERWPENVWPGATVEDQKRAEMRLLPLLMLGARTPFVSCEPLLGSLDLEAVTCDNQGRPGSLDALEGEWWPAHGDHGREGPVTLHSRLALVIAGGESGRGKTIRASQDDGAVDIQLGGHIQQAQAAEGHQT